MGSINGVIPISASMPAAMCWCSPAAIAVARWTGELVEGLQSRDLQLPLLIRFDDILEDRPERLHGALNGHRPVGYAGHTKVFSGECNQQRHGGAAGGKRRRWHFGLEAGSKAELLIALSPWMTPKRC